LWGINIYHGTNKKQYVGNNFIVAFFKICGNKFIAVLKRDSCGICLCKSRFDVGNIDKTLLDMMFYMA